jgi:hypothetical protein
MGDFALAQGKNQHIPHVNENGSHLRMIIISIVANVAASSFMFIYIYFAKRVELYTSSTIL